MQLMCRENKQGYETLSLLQFLEVNLTSFSPKCSLHKNKVENFKTVSNGLFFHAPLMFKKIDTAASNREAVKNFEI